MQKQKREEISKKFQTLFPITAKKEITRTKNPTADEEEFMIAALAPGMSIRGIGPGAMLL